MAQEVQIKLLCDVGENRHEATGTVTLGVNGNTYEVDVCDKHGEEFDKTMNKWSSVGRRAGRTAQPSRRVHQQRTGQGVHTAVREWAKIRGVQVSPKGNIPRAIIEQWEKETGGLKVQSTR